MLQQVTIENFRCFRALTIPLRPLTILIGPNDTGKSAFLAALEYWALGKKLELTDYWRCNSNEKTSIRCSQLGHDGEHLIQERTDGLTMLDPVGYFRLPSNGIAMTTKGFSDEKGPGSLRSDGRGVPALLDYFLRRDRKRFFAVTSAMRSLVPGLEDVGIVTPSPSRRRLDLIVENGLQIPGHQTSTGIRFLLFFLALAFHPTPPKLVLLEEPETGIHPKRLGDVMRLIRETTDGKHGDYPAQVILTTHSPYLLDLVDMENDEVLVFHRNDDGSRIAKPADAERLQNFLDEFMLGEVWYNQGEEGLVARPA